ncbi:MAG TPA: SDR family oxidoreductase [Propionibacteriaceae bacterium]|nr:SDR family oxidoreductase [Propionibacteriaceae bacterium]
MRMAVAGASGLIGAQLTRLARAEGHDVVELSRRAGVDLTRPDAVGDRLDGVEVVVDVTGPPSGSDPARFFTTVAAHLAAAATASGVARSVVLSIVGVDRSEDHPFYAATLAHETATREHAPGVRVARATQFHEFPEMVLRRGAQDGVVEVMDMPTQPVASSEVARTLLELATGRLDADLEVAGPRPERLVDLVREVVRRSGRAITVVPVPAVPSVAGGSVLPGPDALIRGLDWHTWADRRYRA